MRTTAVPSAIIIIDQPHKEKVWEKMRIIFTWWLKISIILPYGLQSTKALWRENGYHRNKIYHHFSKLWRPEHPKQRPSCVNSHIGENTPPPAS